MRHSQPELTPDLKAAASKIKMVVLDVDGVLTDGRLYYSESGHEMKAFNIRDGLGIKLLQKNGIEVGIITGRSSTLLQRRTNELGITLVVQGREDKFAALEEVIAGTAIKLAEVAYMGDDLPDLAAIRQVGLGATVANGDNLVAKYAKWRSEAAGGEGAVRELAELILRAQDKYDLSVAEYL